MGATSRSTSPGQGKSVPRVVHVVRAGNLAAAAAAAVAIGTKRFASIFSMAGSGWTGSRLFVLLASSQPGEGMQTLAGGRSQNKPMEEHIEVEGRILTVIAGTMFRVELDNKHQV